LDTLTGNLLVYEAVSAGVTGRCPAPSLAIEGAAMLAALVDDFSQLPGCQIWTMLAAENSTLPAATLTHLARCERADSLPEHDRLFDLLVSEADRVLLVAPETDGLLLRLTRRAELLDAELLGPSSEWIALVADKLRLKLHLAEHGVAVPPGIVRRLPIDDALPFDYPCIAKPRSDAGTVNNHWLADAAAGRAAAASDCQLVEPCQPGTPVSLVALLADGQAYLLPAGQQSIDLQHSLYHGGELPIAANLADRARQLARQTLAALPAGRGLVGIDMILGDEERADRDVVIEVNPRVTTSYVGLRAALDMNLASLLVGLDRPHEAPQAARHVRFTAAGEVSSSLLTSDNRSTRG